MVLHTAKAMLQALLFLFAVGVVTTVPTPPLDEITPREGEKCGYDSCTDAEPGVLNIHIVPHTHDDVGWLKTVDQYYYGSRNNIQKACVQCILNSVVKELWADPKRKFIYVETAFFWKWWVAQDAAVKSQVHTLVRQGRLQFIGGAWSMNDEAATHYQSTIDQFTWGLQKLNDTFGECGRPRVAWQIDPFGHSREFAADLALMGYDGLFLGRIDYQDKDKRLEEQTMEMVWRGSDDLDAKTDIFTGVLYNTYSPPAGFCFDILCDDEPIITDRNSPMYNLEMKVPLFLRQMSAQAKSYQTNNVLVTMGGDFTYQDASLWYENLDTLIEQGNLLSAQKNLKMKLFYSTPTCYLKAVKDANPTLPTKKDDFFPYASDPTAYWTGYFTSRPTTKRMEREANNFLQTFKMLQVLTRLPETNMFVLNELKSAMGVMQHHDAITGTEKQHVTHDYERIVARAVEDAFLVGNQAFNKLIKSKSGLLEYKRCEFNQSQCSVTERSEAFVVTVFNNQVFPKETTKVDLPIIGEDYTVYDETGNKIKTVIQKLPEEYFVMPTRESNATHNLCFFAKSLPGLGYKNYYVKKGPSKKRHRKSKKVHDYQTNINNYWKIIKDKADAEIKKFEADVMAPKSKINEEKVPVRDNLHAESRQKETINWEVMKDVDGKTDKPIVEGENTGLTKDWVRIARENTPLFSSDGQDMRMLSDQPLVVEEPQVIVLDNEYITLVINKATGWMSHLSKADGTALNYLPVPGYYIGCEGDNNNSSNRSSGAYIFRPNMTASPDLVTLNTFTVTDIIQSEKQEVRIHYDSSVCLTVGLKDDTTYFQTILNIDEGREYVLRFKTVLKTDGVFYTDSNGRQMLKRKRNSRPDWDVTLLEPIPGNYYPVVNEIYIEDDSLRVALNVDRARGGSSLKDGSFEIMQHRRLKHDDAFGVGEALNETAGGVGLYSIDTVILKVIPKSKENLIKAAETALKFFSEPQLYVAEATFGLDKFKTMNNVYSFLKSNLPEGVHLLTLEPWKNNKILIRFENYLDTELSPEYISVDLTKVFKTIEIKAIKETTLAANRWLEDYKQWKWNTDEDDRRDENEDVPKTSFNNKLIIKLKAKEIRTFVADYKYVVD